MARPGERRIPTALKKLFLFLNGEAIEVEGLFRIPADPSEVALIKKACDAGEASKVLVASAGEARVHGAGGAVKEYLRTLPEPLLTWELYAAFIDAAALSDAASGAQRRSSVAGLLERLPAPNRALAQVLFLYLARLADHAHRNHMNSTNLAMIFGPLLLRPQHESVESMLHGPRVTSVVKYIIDSYDLLFTQKGTAKNESAADGVGGKGSGSISVPASPRSEGDVETLAGSAPPHKFQQIVEAIDESIALVQSKLLALHKQLEATDSMEEAIQIAKKIRTAKRILFHDDHKPTPEGEGVAAQDAAHKQAAGSPRTVGSDKADAAADESQHAAPAAVVASEGGGPGLGLESGYESQQGIRKTMEDAHVLIDDLRVAFPQLASADSLSPPLAFYAVYDGHSGTEAALEAAEVVHAEVIKQPGFVEGRMQEALEEGFRKADAHILEKSARDGWKNGTTAVTAFILSRTIYVANAGDSEAIMGQKQADGSYKPVVLSHKHKPTDKDEKERIRAAGGHVVFGRLFGDLAVSRSLGDPDYKKPLSEANYISAEPHVSATELLTDKDEFLIIGCDGVWDVVNYQEALDLVAGARQGGQTAGGAAQALVKRALEKGSKDNVTVVVVYFTWRS